MLRISKAFAILTVVSGMAQAQGGNSPYSLYGPGEIIQQGNLRNLAMGGTSLANGNFLYANIQNPALLTCNYFTVFEAGYLIERKWISRDKVTQRDLQGNPSYFALIFPILSKAVKASYRSRLVIGTGLRPFTFLNTEDVRRQYIPGTPAYSRATYKTFGGINQWFLGMGYQINRRFSVGAETNLHFGSLTNLQVSALENIQNFYTLNYTDRLTVSAFNFKFGCSYTDSLPMGKSSKWLIHAGATFVPASQLGAVFNRSVIRKDLSDRTIQTDTIINDQRVRLAIPAQMGGGISIEKVSAPLSPFKISFSLEAHLSPWSEYRNPVGTPEFNQLSDMRDLRFGVEVVPNPLAVSGYFKRIQYRFGYCIVQTPWVIGGRQIIDQNLSAGISLPVGRNYTSLNFTTLWGQRGVSTPTQYGERYIKLFIGLTINDKWFIRRKFL